MNKELQPIITTLLVIAFGLQICVVIGLAFPLIWMIISLLLWIVIALKT